MNIKKLNSATKYPEIPTYHRMDKKGILQPELTMLLDPEGLYHASEKINGINTRMVFFVSSGDCDYFLGSREELLFAKGDRIFNPQLNIVKELYAKAESIAATMQDWEASHGVYSVYGELYGGNLPATKQYSTKEEYAYRCFDMTYMSFTEYLEYVLKRTPEEISNWRKRGSQYFYTMDKLECMTEKLRLYRAPIINSFLGKSIPIGIEETYEFLQRYRYTKAGIDTKGLSEGIVLRSWDGNHGNIVKLRFEDYERALGLTKKQKR